MRNPELDRAFEAMGKYNEKMYMPIIREQYGNLVKSEFKYDTIDFYGVDYMVELKSRCCSSTSFTDTMFGYNKLIRAMETLEQYKDTIPNYKVYFAFAFTDGLFIWEYNQTNYELNGGDSQKRIGGTSERGWDDYKDHYYVFVKNLTKISDKPVWIHPAVQENKNKTYEKNRIKNKIPDGVCFLKLMKTT